MTCGKHQLLAEKKTLENEDVILPSPNSCGWEIHDAIKKWNKPSENIGKIRASQNRTIFPRSPVFEYKSINKQTLKDMNGNKRTCDVDLRQNKSKLDENKITPAEKLRLNCPPSFRSATLNPYSYAPIEPWCPQPQFWYQVEAAHIGPTWPVGNPDDYNRFQPLPQSPPPPGQLHEALEIERPERYLPGEIYKNKTPKDPVEDLHGTGGCKPIWEPKCPEVFNSKFDPSTLPKQPLLADMVKEKEAELRRLIITNNNQQNDKTTNENQYEEKFCAEQQKPTKVAFRPEINVGRNDMINIKGEMTKLEPYDWRNKNVACDNQKKGILKSNDAQYQQQQTNQNDKDFARKCCNSKSNKN